MIEKFPHRVQNTDLRLEDFSVFYTDYLEIIRRLVPVVENITFLTEFTDVTGVAAFLEWEDDPEPLLKQLRSGELDFSINEELIFLSFPVENSSRVIVVLSAIEEVALEKVNRIWLAEVRKNIEYEFSLFRQSRIDGQTGLLNLACLRSLLEGFQDMAGWRLLLVQLPGGGLPLYKKYLHTQRSTNLLKSLARGRFLLYYLGQNTFCVVVRQGNLSNLESNIVQFFKKEGFGRVYIGASYQHKSCECGNQEGRGVHLLDEAWLALQLAVTRGPFSFCEYHSMIYPPEHPLASSDKNLVRKIGRMVRDLDAFSLVLLNSEICSFLSENKEDLFENNRRFVRHGRQIFLVWEHGDIADVKKWTDELITTLSEKAGEKVLLAGISRFPFCDYKKSQMVSNCKKALLHASYYEKSCSVVFDAVSLNISGDIYFGDGDLRSAVKEYKKGLSCCDGDVNLYNSLGVSYAMMNRHLPAVSSFEKALEQDSQNFMALYNLGLVKQSRRQLDAAVGFFQQALQSHEKDEADPEVIADLEKQLGILCCELGDYRGAVEYLEPWCRRMENSPKCASAVFFLGEAYHNLGENKKATGFLQKALQYDSFDTRAMNVLGRIYLQEGEGDDVALTLCRKSVELNPEEIAYKIDLADVLLQCQEYGEAIEILRSCLRNKQFGEKVRRLLAKAFGLSGDKARAKLWQKKVEKSSHFKN